jgi:hypothetical protein
MVSAPAAGAKLAQPCATRGLTMNSFRHSGKLGDIIYSLPAVKSLGGGSYFVDHRTEYLRKPPLGKQAAKMMTDLLLTQHYIQHAALYDGQPVTCDLDRFREIAVGVHFFNGVRAQTNRITGMLFGGLAEQTRAQLIPKIEIDLPQCHWECAALPGKANVEPWLSGINKKRVADIVICKTNRHPGKLEWNVLRPFAQKAVFIGFETEHVAFSCSHFLVEFYKATDLVDLAEVIAGAKLFVGNQCFGLALADAMSLPRVVEVWDESPNRMSAMNAHCVLTRDIVERYVQP